MYNGIGLQTARGSGTNGYVQANKFLVKRRTTKIEAKEFQEGAGTSGITRKANRDILEHERKRQVELKLLVLREALEEQGYTEEEIDEQIAAARVQLEDDPKAADSESLDVSKNQSHQLVARKEKKMETFKAALGIREGAKEGEAFDRELQEQKRQERMLAREEAEREKQLKEKEMEREERRREKELKKKEKEERKRLRAEERAQRKRDREDAEEEGEKKGRTLGEKDAKRDSDYQSHPRKGPSDEREERGVERRHPIHEREDEGYFGARRRTRREDSDDEYERKRGRDERSMGRRKDVDSDDSEDYRERRRK